VYLISHQSGLLDSFTCEAPSDSSVRLVRDKHSLKRTLIQRTHRGPSFQDLVNSDQGHTVISMLLDVNGFWQYDNR
jgi:hypothetical protein